MDTIRTRLASLFNPLTALLSRLYHAPPLQITLLASSAALAALTHAIYTDYTTWHALGPSGAPHNLLGYAAQALLRPFVPSDTTSPAPYLSTRAVSQYRRAATTHHLRDLPRRSGSAPPIAPYPIPQRQSADHAPADVRAAYVAAFAGVAARHAEIVTARPSRLEGGHGPAWFAREGARVPDWADATRREIAHVHAEADGSAHVLLCPRDAREVLAKGWGERHALSGMVLPVGYVMVYAPRTVAEVETVIGILEAGVKGVFEGVGEML